jgi:transcriptional regulator with XRE-family HTH domain
MTGTTTSARFDATSEGADAGSDGNEAIADRVRRRELGSFLRSRRERITPEQVGFPPGPRRRTPGLRREEVAQLSGVGVTWYTWLEQGRAINVSEQVLDAISRTLLLDPHERSHLFTLAGTRGRIIENECRSLTPVVHTLLDKLDPYPACVLNARHDILAFNRTYGGLVDDLAAMPFEDRNTLWLAFTHPGWRRAIVDWDDAVCRMVAQYRAAMAEHVAEPAWKALVRRLHHASPEFGEVWARHEVRPLENRTKQLRHAELGTLRLDYTNMWFGELSHTRFVTYSPADTETAERLVRLQELLLVPSGDRGAA